ncbi:hypothetical protein C0Q70_16937 [Pomacea canaliculata]|uniref:Mitogen-activated protein kinase n=1 Tax=Pomacea canaliculata TaxID=400727 RepID=A0A2T7NR66_POMCA|nr:hypothetical protein C0Q70_16937 [Pomacea canaliculata]
MSSEIEPHITKKYEIKKRLGKGAYGIVWKAIDRRTGEVVAVKKIFDAFRNQTDAQRTFREIMFLQEFGDHPNVIKLHNVIKAENDKDIYLVFEFMETDLHNVIKRGNILKDVHKRYVMYQLFKAIKYLHSGNVIHRDLKPSNILLDSECVVKLCDFGLARSLTQIGIDEAGDPNLTEYVATRWYRAPEILLASHRAKRSLDDMLAEAPADGLDLLRRLLHFNPDKRITAEEALKHSFVSRFHNPVEEISLHFDVVPPLSDDIQLTVDQYRSKLYEMIMQKKAERRRRRREEARVAAAHAHAEEHEETQVMEHAPKENASSLLSQGVAEVPAKNSADHVSQYQEFPLKQHHQSSFAAFGRTTHEGPPTYGPSRPQKPPVRQRSHENMEASIQAGAVNRQTSAPAAIRGQGRPISGLQRAQHPTILRDDKTGLMVSSSRMVPGQRPISAGIPRAKPVYGRKQFSNAINNPSTGAPKAIFGSYSQAYGTITSTGLAAIQGQKS